MLVAACAVFACCLVRPVRAEGGALTSRGVNLSLAYRGEVLGDASGGMRRGAAYEGRVELRANVDLAKLAGWRGTTLHTSVYHISGYGQSTNYVGNFMDVSNIEARPAARLYALWMQKTLFGGAAAVRAGQLGADEDFLISNTSSRLINGTFGWAALAAADQTNGGPAYPLATPGIRLRLAPRRDLSFLLAAFAGNPAGSRCRTGPQRCDRYGTTFSRRGRTLWMSELRYAVNQGTYSTGLPGAYKLGGWYEVGPFADERYGVLATGATSSIASGATIGPLNHDDDWGLYTVADQTLWHARDGRALSAFVRLGGAPADRNLVSLYVDAGLGLKGPFAARPCDTLTLGVAHAGISPDAVALDRDRRLFGEPDYPMRDYESVIEVSYVARMTRRLSLQPDVQYVIHPGGNIPDPNNPSHAIRNALVLGVRVSLHF